MAKTKAKATVTSDENRVVTNAKGTSITVSKVFDKPPKAGQLAVGEVGQYTNSKGKTVYVVGNNNGGVSSAKTNIAAAASTVNKVVKTAETRQLRDLAYENKVELSQLGRTLKAEGLPKSEINKIVAAEKRANSAEYISAKSALRASGYQTLGRNDTGLLGATTVENTADGIVTPKTFNTTVITNPDGTKTPTLNSLLYSGTGADAARANGAKYINLVDEFAYSHGLSTNYNVNKEGKTTTSTGVDPYLIYRSLNNGFIKVNPVEKENTDGTKYIDNDFVIGKKIGDESPLGRSLGEGFVRQITDVLNRGTEIGDKAFAKEVNGKIYITTPGGRDLLGNDQPLTYTGERDDNGNKIYSQLSNLDSRYKQASTLNVYVQNKDGSFTYMGTPNTGYTQTEKQKGGFSFGNFIKGVALTVGASMLGQTYLAPLIQNAFGFSKGVAEIAAAALTGGGVSAIQGSDLKNVLTDSVLAAIGQGVGGVVSKAAGMAGGYTALMDDIAKNGVNGFISQATNALYSTNASTGIKLITDNAGNIVSAADDVLKSSTQLGTGVNLNNPLIDASKSLATTGQGLLDDVISKTPVNTNTGGQTTVPRTTAGDIYESQMGGVTDIANQVDLAPITTAPGINSGAGIGLQYDKYGSNTIVNPATGQPYAPPGTGLQYDAAGNVIGDTGTGIGTGVNLVNPSTGSLVTPPATTTPTTPAPSTPGLLDSIQKATGLSPWQQVALVGGAGLGVAGYNAIQDMLNKQPTEPSYPSFDLNLPTNNSNMLGMPQWWQDLYSRGGYGAGNYLGYDILKGINIPSDVQSLLGMNSGQNTGSSLIA